MNSSLMPERTAHNHNLRVMTSAGDVRRNVGGRDTPPEETRPSRRSTNTKLKHFGGKINEKHLKVLGSLPLLLAPIILLTLLKGVVARLIIVSLFLSFFALIGAVMTKARSWEVIAATAA